MEAELDVEHRLHEGGSQFASWQAGIPDVHHGCMLQLCVPHDFLHVLPGLPREPGLCLGVSLDGQDAGRLCNPQSL